MTHSVWKEQRSAACVGQKYSSDMMHSHMRHDLFLCVTCQFIICMCTMTNWYVWNHSFTCATLLIHMCNVTHSCVRRGSSICATWHIYTHNSSYMGVWFLYNTNVLMFPRTRMMSINMRAMTRAYVYHKATCGLHICVTWLMNRSIWEWARQMMLHSLAKKILIQMRDMTHSYVQHDSFICVQ